MSVVLNFDASTVTPQASMEVIPAGDVTAALIEATVVETSNKDGHYMKCVYSILEGKYKGRKIFDNLNLWNKSKQATDIAWSQLSAVCHACGRLQVGDVSELFGIPLTLKLGIEQSEKYGPSNIVRSFDKVGAMGGPAGGFAPTASPAAPPGPPAAPPAATPPAAPPAEAAPDASAPWNQPAENATPAATPPPTATPPATPAPTATDTPAPAPGAPTDSPPWATAPAAPGAAPEATPAAPADTPPWQK